MAHAGGPSGRRKGGRGVVAAKARLDIDPAAAPLVFDAAGKLGAEFPAEPVDQRRDGFLLFGRRIREDMGADLIFGLCYIQN